MKKINQIIELCDNNGIEIVSHGLAPNPNGFCYEAPDNTPKQVHKKLNSLLDSLTKSETQKLIETVF